MNVDSQLCNCVPCKQYLAPEVLRKQPYDNTVDWWCLGSVLYEMLYGLVCFHCLLTCSGCVTVYVVMSLNKKNCLFVFKMHSIIKREKNNGS